ncbi:MAG: polysaccharide deacetylase family protein, partial [Anaerolineae bacterium]|nr:polysaccharide deacetylase family protein [Anaerolineae bacterium]
PISLAQLHDGLQTGQLPRRAVVVTFDDGYVDMLHQAQPLLAQYDIPATVFVVAGHLGQELWWDELARLILAPASLPDGLPLGVNGRLVNGHLPHRSRTDSRADLRTEPNGLLHTLYQELLAQPDMRPTALAELRAWSPAAALNPDDTATARVMSGAELTTLTRNSLIGVGSHTMTHTPLASLPAEAQAVEISQSKAVLEEVTGQSVLSFSYPHGQVTAVAPRLVQEAGYTLACASQNGMAHPGSNPFCLPRFWPPDWDESTFTRWLRRWLHD